MERTKIVDTKAGKIQGIKDEGIEIWSYLSSGNLSKIANTSRTAK